MRCYYQRHRPTTAWTLDTPTIFSPYRRTKSTSDPNLIDDLLTSLINGKCFKIAPLIKYSGYQRSTFKTLLEFKRALPEPPSLIPGSNRTADTSLLFHVIHVHVNSKATDFGVPLSEQTPSTL